MNDAPAKSDIGFGGTGVLTGAGVDAAEDGFGLAVELRGVDCGDGVSVEDREGGVEGGGGGEGTAFDDCSAA